MNEDYVRDILDSLLKIQSYTAAGREVFMSSDQCQDAVIRRIEIIGEATKRLDKNFTTQYPDVPWKDMAGMRDKLIHDYVGVDLARVWETVEKDLPVLRKRLAAILERKG